jgi:hypothetical protein
MRKPKQHLTIELDGQVLEDVNLLSRTGVRLRIVPWDELPHILYTVGAREAWDRIQWDEFRRLATGEDLRKVLPWWDKEPKFSAKNDK